MQLLHRSSLASRWVWLPCLPAAAIPLSLLLPHPCYWVLQNTRAPTTTAQRLSCRRRGLVCRSSAAGEQQQPKKADAKRCCTQHTLTNLLGGQFCCQHSPVSWLVTFIVVAVPGSTIDSQVACVLLLSDPSTSCRAAAEAVIDRFVSSNTAVAFGNGELVSGAKRVQLARC